VAEWNVLYYLAGKLKPCTKLPWERYRYVDTRPRRVATEWDKPRKACDVKRTKEACQCSWVKLIEWQRFKSDAANMPARLIEWREQGRRTEANIHAGRVLLTLNINKYYYFVHSLTLKCACSRQWPYRRLAFTRTIAETIEMGGRLYIGTCTCCWIYEKPQKKKYVYSQTDVTLSIAFAYQENKACISDL
jgi:hypothetical protein